MHPIHQNLTLNPIFPHLTPSIYSYLHWLSDLFSYIPHQNSPPSPSCLSKPRQTKQSSAYKRPGSLQSLSLPLEILPHSPFSPQSPSTYIHWKDKGSWLNLLTPLSILKHSLSSPFTLTQERLLPYLLLIPFNSLQPTSYVLISCHNASLLTQSYSYCNSIKPTYVMFFSLMFAHSTCFRVKIWSTHPLPALKPPHIFYQPHLTG